MNRADKLNAGNHYGGIVVAHRYAAIIIRRTRISILRQDGEDKIMSRIRLLQTTIRHVTHFPTSHALTWSCTAKTQNNSLILNSFDCSKLTLL
jgi:hypothetical protein